MFPMMKHLDLLQLKSGIGCKAIIINNFILIYLDYSQETLIPIYVQPLDYFLTGPHHYPNSLCPSESKVELESVGIFDNA